MARDNGFARCKGMAHEETNNAVTGFGEGQCRG